MPPLSQAAPFPYPEAGAVRVGPNEAETIAGNVLAPHSKCDDGGGVPGQEVLGWGFRAGLSQSTGLQAPAQVPTSLPPPHPQYLALRLDIPALGLLEFTEAGLEEAAAALCHRCRERALSRLMEAGRRHTRSLPAPCPGHSP